MTSNVAVRSTQGHAPPVPAQTASGPAATAAIGPQQTALPPGENGDDAYLSRSELTVPPVALEGADVPYPAFDGDEGHYVGRLWLFIDEAGVVQRVEVDQGELPPPLEAAVRQTFLAARFEPGQLNGRAVRSRIRIEVKFDAGLPRR